MSEGFDFEREWLRKFGDCLEKIAGQTVCDAVLTGSETLTDQSDRQEVIAWTQGAMARLEAELDAEQCRAVMTGCACHYPREQLEGIRRAYESSGSVDLALQMLQEHFEVFMRDDLHLSGAEMEEFISRCWGLAGIRVGDTIIVTKIPKSAYAKAYLAERDPERRRQMYCHCPRIREGIGSGAAISPVYCFCGAGFYQDIWEEILQQPVRVELLESLLKGDQICRIAIHLPVGC